MSNEKPQELAQKVMLQIGRLTVTRNIASSRVLQKMFELCTAITQNDSNAAVFAYHSLTSTMLNMKARRITGDIWKDQIFAELIENPNVFSQLAASHSMDPAVKESMTQDLRLLQELFVLNSQEIISWIEYIALHDSVAKIEENEQKPIQPKKETKTRNLVQAAWMGEEFADDDLFEKHSKIYENYRKYDDKNINEEIIESTERKINADILDFDHWVQWGYADPAELVEYVADEALAILYRKFLASDDWRTLTDELEAFFWQYGSGIFLRYRFFAVTENCFSGVETNSIRAMPWDDLYGMDKAKEKLYANALRFLHTGYGENVLLYGHEGMGKTSSVVSLVREMPELRLVSFAQKEAVDACEFIQELAKQPFKFIALLDDISMEEKEYRKLKRVLSTRMGPRNVLLFATATRPSSDKTLFPLQIAFAKPIEDDFIIMVNDLLRRNQLTLDKNDITQECKAWLDDCEDTSTRSAMRLTNRLLRENRIAPRGD